MSDMSLRSPALPYCFMELQTSLDRPRPIAGRKHYIGSSRPDSRTRARTSKSALLRRVVTAAFIATSLAHVNAQPSFGGYAIEAEQYVGDGFSDIIFDEIIIPQPPIAVHKRDSAHTTHSLLPSSIAPPKSTHASGSDAPIQTASNPKPLPLPQPLDANIGNNFTSSTCASFFQTLRSDSKFEACHPLSLLLQTSNSFFEASHDNVTLARAINASCNIDYNSCSSLMAGYAQQIQQDDNCGQDAALGNPIVLQTSNGLAAYDSLYWAGCLHSDAGNDYCIVNAMTNASTPTSSYVYYLPLGVSLPAGTRPPCDTCLHDTMNIFQKMANNTNTILAHTYGSAAQMIDINCGPTFVGAAVVNSMAGAGMNRITAIQHGALALITASLMALFMAVI